MKFWLSRTRGAVLIGAFALAACHDSSNVGGAAVAVGGGPGNGGSLFQGTIPAPVGAGNDTVIHDDLNGDGVQDLVVANRIGRFVSVLLGAGDGTFQEVDRYLSTAHLFSGGLATGDFNSDGVRDVVSTDGQFLGVGAVLLGHGDGTLEPPASYNPAAKRPGGIAVADMTGDGVEDLVIAGGYHSLAVIVGNGDGTFGSVLPTTVPDSEFAFGVAVGDLDGDGAMDVVTTDIWSPQVHVFRGHGDGTLTHVQKLTAPATEVVKLGYLDGDAALDLVLGASDGYLPLLQVGINQGNGTFGPLTSYQVGTRPGRLELSDLNADGAVDVVVSDQLGSDVAVLLNDGSGALQGAVSYPAGRFPSGLTIADLNGDDRLDLAVGNGGPGLSTLMGNGDGTFQPPEGMVFGAGASALLVTDLDGDGGQDLVFGNYGSASISVARAAGGGLFHPGEVFPLGDDPLRIARARLDADPYLDIAVATDCNKLCKGFEILTGQADGAFLPGGDAGRAESLAAGDLNGDGMTDFAVTRPAMDYAAVFLASGGGAFWMFSEEPLPWIADAVAINDFDNDGVLDIVAASDTYAGVMRGLGDGTFESTGEAVTMPDLTGEMVTGDLDNDGNADFVTLSRQFDFVTLMFGAGDGVTFTPFMRDLGTANTSSLLMADLNADSWEDLAFIMNENVAVLWNEGGSFAGELQLFTPAGSRPSSIAVADVDDDQRPDLVVTDIASNDVTVLSNVMP